MDAWPRAREARLRNGPEAVDLAGKAVELSRGQSAEILGTLAAAYAETGRFADAVRTADRAANLASAHGDSKLADACRAQLTVYRSGRPYRDKN